MNSKTLAALAASLALVAGCAQSPTASQASAAGGGSGAIVAPTSAAAVGELRPGTGILNGYLAPADLPDSLSLLPAPPAPGSAAAEADIQAFRELTRLQGTPRGAMAVSDANLHFPEAASTFSCALGVQVSAQATPNLHMLLQRSLTDMGMATYKAKNKYLRTRPFVALKTGSCTPQEEAFLIKDPSYPSGHSSVGWGWALLLTELAPDRSDALLLRGRAFSQSRAICGVHWKSDVEAGRLVGAATVARLHANPVFNAQMAAARDEIAKARVTASSPSEACAAEARTIAGASATAP